MPQIDESAEARVRDLFKRAAEFNDAITANVRNRASPLPDGFVMQELPGPTPNGYETNTCIKGVPPTADKMAIMTVSGVARWVVQLQDFSRESGLSDEQVLEMLQGLTNAMAAAISNMMGLARSMGMEMRVSKPGGMFS